MTHLIGLIWLAILTRLSFALDPVGAVAGFLVNNSTKGMFTMNGIWYPLSNSTTDLAKMDSLTDAEACTRDAALMSQLGINTVYVDALDTSANHDDCFSIFNSVGIYIAIVLNANLFVDDGAIDNTYIVDRLKKMFEWIDAVKDYENLLAIDIGVLPELYAMEAGRFSDAQKIYRAIIRDTREYIQRNSPRPILVGGSLTRFQDEGENVTMFQPLMHASCGIDNEDIESAAEFISLYDFDYYEYDPTDVRRRSFERLRSQLNGIPQPVWFSSYGTASQNGEPTFEVFNETLEETAMIYNVSNELIMPYGPLTGGARYEWTNVRFNEAVGTNWGITIIDPSGNIQLTENYDILRDIFSQYNTESWLSGSIASPPNSGDTRPKCSEDLLVNTTSSIGEGSTLTVATDWELPTRPPGLDALITSGASGSRGQMVDVLVTTINYEIKDSKGEVITDVQLSPSKSEARSTTSTQLPTGGSSSTTSTGLSTGTRAGIGIGVGVGAMILLGGMGLLLLRWRRKRKATVANAEVNGANSDDMKKGETYEKAELATGPEVEAQPAAELPGKSMETPKEVPGDGYPGIGAEPAELPVTERPLELSSPQNARDETR